MFAEANFDGLIGPTHNYGGLSDGNIASKSNAGDTSNPRAAALQGLDKMGLMAGLGLWQGILPPHQRPHLPTLRAAGFCGSDPDVFSAAWKQDPQLARWAMSASAMWTANAGAVSPAPDCGDGQLHISPANLLSMPHRALESPQTTRSLRAVFPFATVHEALPPAPAFADEGAANHVRLCGARGEEGVELFVWGREERATTDKPARQTLRASQAVARRHGVSRAVFARQSDAAIEAGAFHNDVVCVGAMETLLYHELAFTDAPAMRADVRAAAGGLFDPVFVEVPESHVPIGDAIRSYLFNSMLVAEPGEVRLTLIAPGEVEETQSVRKYLDHLVSGNGPIGRVRIVDVRQSMRNGGGPACLRLRVTLSDVDWAKVPAGFKAAEAQIGALKSWVGQHYRDRLAPGDLSDPALMQESFAALDELTTLMGLGADFYPFQR